MAEQHPLAFALTNLLREQEGPDKIRDEFMTYLQNEFQWLKEIPETVCSVFTVKSKKLEQMPKTPCVKKKMQMRKRKKDEVSAADLESTPTSAKVKHEITVEDDVDADSVLSSNTGRPVRKCRVSKNVAAAKTAPKKGLNRQCKKKLEGSYVKDETLSPKTAVEEPVQIHFRYSGAGSSKIVNEAPVTAARSPQISGNVNSDDSPSVRARVKQYEVLIENLIPVKQPSPKPIATKSAPEAHSVFSLQPSHESASRIAEQQSISKKDKTRRSSKKSKESPKDSPVPRQTRTRLRLNKQPIEQPKDTNVEVETEPVSPKKAGKYDTPITSTNRVSDSDKDESDVDMIDTSINNRKSSTPHSLSETQVVISEVFEVCENGEGSKLKKYEMVKTKTTPITNILNVSDNEHKVPSSPSSSTFRATSSDEDIPDGREPTKKQVESDKSKDTSEGMSTRTRTRAKQNNTIQSEENVDKGLVVKNKDSGVGMRRSSENANSTFTVESESGSDGEIGRSTRTRARLQKEKEKIASDAKAEEPVQSTRTRQRAQAAEAAAAKATDAEGIRQGSQKATEVAPAPNKKGQNNMARFLTHGSDEKITGSPSLDTHRPSLRGAKRLVEHGRGLSPAPKRARSNMGEELMDARPLSTSSPIKNYDESELRDKVLSASKAPRPFNFTNAQKNTSGFLSRTPGFTHSTSKTITFMNTPNSAYRNGGVRSFLKKTSPSPQLTAQNMLEQRRIKLIEKQKRDEEKVNRQKELKKRNQEEKQRQREGRFQRAAALRLEREEQQRQAEEQLMKRLGNTAALKAKMQEEREKEEAERRKQRQKKQMEADLRRKQEEEERQRKRQELEEEARAQEMMYLKKRRQEEYERKRKIAEEKARAEERLAEKHQKLMEERAKILQMQREKEIMLEKARLDKENQLLQERMERERMEREKKAEKEKKLKEDMERLKAMEQERLYLREQELQKQREQKQIINDHNKSLLTQKKQNVTVELPNPPKAAPAVLNTTQTLNTSKTLHTSVTNSNSYEITPAKTYNKQNQNPNDYGLEDMGSDDSTDDEGDPKKRIPEWAMGMSLSTAVIKQCMTIPDPDPIFRTLTLVPPDLEKIFKGFRKRRYKERTSSAVWNTPPMKYS